MEMCNACHSVANFVVIPGVTRWAEVYACPVCGTLKIRVESIDKQNSKNAKEEGGDT